MSVISLFQFNESKMAYIFFNFSCYVNTYKMFSEEKLSQAGQKTQQSSGIKSFYSNTPYGFEYEKNCINKLSIKMFIK